MSEPQKGRMRHPLRNEWDQVSADYAALATKKNREGAIARVMLAVVPAFIDAMERERDEGTAPDALFDAIAAASGCMIENAIDAQPAIVNKRAGLYRMLTMIETVVVPRITSKGNGLIIPRGMHG
jgi:hypothetical protein